MVERESLAVELLPKEERALAGSGANRMLNAIALAQQNQHMSDEDEILIPETGFQKFRTQLWAFITCDR